MSEFRIDQITNQSGSRGPDIAGITTFSATSGMLMPSGDTFKRNVVENVVKDGLVLYLDAGNDFSYPGSGTTWADLGDNGYDFNLINGPTFNSSNLGGIEQDGTNDYLERTHTTDLAFTGNVSFTLQIVAKTKTLTHNPDYPAIMSCGDANSGGGWQFDLYDDNNFSGEFGEIVLGRYQTGGSYINAGGACGYRFTSVSDANSTNFWCYTYSSSNGGKLYRNGNLISSNTSTGSITRSTTPNVFIGRRGTNASRVTNCIFYSVSAYNRALSPQEIQQNFNALRGRYGL
jgi:hypothetical protein